MPRVLSYALGTLGGVALSVMVSGCSNPEQPMIDVGWGSEASRFFDEMSLAHNAGDLYDTLDFYASSATVDMSGTEPPGEFAVVDRLRWNSGDLNHDLLAIHLESDAALNLVRWTSNDEPGAVVTSIDGGIVSHQTMYGVGRELARRLKTTPSVVARYEELYARYSTILSSGDARDIASLYASDAVLRDSLLSIDAIGAGFIVAERSTGMWTDIAATRVSGTQDAAVYLGPGDYGQDPNRAIGVYLATDASGCAHQIAVRWLLEDGLILDERWFHEIDSFSACVVDDEPSGWWTGLDLPQQRESVLTSVLRTTDGQDIEVFNGSERLELLVDDAIVRFTDVGISEPRIGSITFEPSRSCSGRSGRIIVANGLRRVFLCVYESDLCPTSEACDLPSSSVRLAVLHELGHAWMLDHATDETKKQVLALSGREVWQANDVPWADRGVEYAADVIAWGLIDGSVELVRIGSPSCQELSAAFRLLTATDPPHPGTECTES